LLVCDLFDYETVALLPFEVLQNAVRKKTCKTTGIDTSESSTVACFGVGLF